eukprot:2815578-Pyramimonas_sp.AAC.1
MRAAATTMLMVTFLAALATACAMTQPVSYALLTGKRGYPRCSIPGRHALPLTSKRDNRTGAR